MPVSSTLVRPRPISSAQSQTQTLKEEIALAKLVLGKRMYATGIDDGKSAERITALNHAIAYAQSDTERQELTAQRDRWFDRLANAALEYDAPLPGANSEYKRVQRLLASQRASG